MKTPKILVVLVMMIVVLSLIACGMAILSLDSRHQFEYKTVRGETVLIQGGGLYKYDSVSLASQGISQDVVTLVVGIPLLIVACVLTMKRSLRGKLLLTGTLGYFLYTYTSYAFALAFNVLFLLYVALFTLSLSSLILVIGSYDVNELSSHFSEGLPRRAISTFSFIVGIFLLFNWLGHIVPALLQNTIPDLLLGSTTLVIQVLDLGLLVPLAFLSGILLLRKNPWGYLLSSLLLIKGFTLSLAIVAMIIGQWLASVQMSLPEVAIFVLLAVVDAVMTYLLITNIKEPVHQQYRLTVQRMP
jgi:hypothetical protein